MNLTCLRLYVRLTFFFFTFMKSEIKLCYRCRNYIQNYWWFSQITYKLHNYKKNMNSQKIPIKTYAENIVYILVSLSTNISVYFSI